MWHCDKYTFVLPLNIHLIPKLVNHIKFEYKCYARL